MHFDSNGVRIRYVEQGQGEAVVLVHSYTGTLEDGWVDTGVLPRLAQNFRVIAFDARGHGRSDKPHDPQRYGREMAFDIVRLMDHLGVGKAHIAGYSMGAHTVAQLATLHPERFLKMTLGGACGRRNWTAQDDARTEREAAEMDAGLLTSQLVRLRPQDKARLNEAKIRRLSAQVLAGQDRHALAAVRRSTRDQALTDAQLAAIRIPTLGIVGSADPYMKDFVEVRRLMPHMKLVVIDGASHSDAVRRPEFVNALEAFLLDAA